MRTPAIDSRLAKWYTDLDERARQQFLADTFKTAKKTGAFNDRFKRFQKTYFNDWAAFVVDCFDWGNEQSPTDYQLGIIADLQQHRRKAVRGPHGLGKTALASWTILAFALTRDGLDWKVPTTASAWRQLRQYLWPEIHKWARKLRWDKIGREPFDTRRELLTLNLKLTTGEAFAVASDNPDLIEGAHADHLLYLFDEAKAIPDDTFNAAEGAFSGAGADTAAEAYALAISTPGEPAGRFYDIHKRKPGYEDWHVRYVKLDEVIAAGRISAQWAEQRKQQWGETSAVYQNRVVGEFAANDEDAVIPLSWIEAANERWYAWKEAGFPGQFTAVGVDIGGGGEHSDKTVEALAYDKVKIKELRKFPRGDIDKATMEEAGRTKGILDAYGGVAVLDIVGLGAGTYHRLREQGYKNALGFSAGSRAERMVHGKSEPVLDKTGELGFADKRSAAWWIFRELLDPNDGMDVCLPPDDELTGELTAPKSRTMSGGRRKVESKDDIKDRIKRSTDSADAVIQAVVGPELCQEESRWRTIEFKSV